MLTLQSDYLEQILRDTILAIVRGDDRDLTGRQLGIFLTVYLQDEHHTVRSLAAELNAPKPSITRSLNRLADLELVQREPDPRDGRSVLVARTIKGSAFLRELRRIVTKAAKLTSADG